MHFWRNANHDDLAHAKWSELPLLGGAKRIQNHCFWLMATMVKTDMFDLKKPQGIVDRDDVSQEANLTVLDMSQKQ